MLHKQLSRAGLIAISLATLAAPFWQLHSTFADTPNWLSAESPRVVKTGDLASNTVPYSKGLDCNEKTLLDPVYKTTLTGCSVSTAAGPIVNGYYTDGIHQTARVFQSLLQSYGDSQLMYWSSGETSIYPALTKTQLVFNNSGNSPGYNYVPAAPQRLLKSANGKTIYLDVYNMAYSNNGEWLVANVMPSATGGTGNGIMVFDTKTYAGKMIAPLNTYSTLFGGNDTPGAGNLAVSDDGRYVAASYTQTAQNMPEKGLRIYDASTCTDQYPVTVSSRTYCTYKNVWTGKLNGKTKTSAGIQEQLSQVVERPLNVRFKDTGTITFRGVYDYAITTNTMKAATYEATMLPALPPPIKLLALGDSYISGEGAYSYISGTDTDNNKCHQSSLSYPYLLGAQYATEYHSVACSGALTNDIMDTSDDYKNQLIPKIRQGQYLDPQRNEYLSNNTPGYLNQLQFISQTKPNAILLSIGGNDIAFADIVKRCVISFAWDPCYHKQSERKSLLLTIYSKFSLLKSTYDKILSEAPSGARLYVMGYPQVINPTGNCGANVHFDDSEKQFASLLIDRLNATVKAAAESSGAVYVDVSGALVGHRLCDTHDDGVNGLTNGDDKFSIGAWVGANNLTLGLGNESYHPTALGHKLLASAIAAQTDGLTKQSPGAANVLLPTLQDDDEFITTGIADDAKARRIQQQEIVSANVVSTGEKLTLNLDAASSGIQQGSPYQVVFHSDEVTVAQGILPASGELQIDTIVPKLAPGIHSIHIYTTDINGQEVDIAENIYIVASTDDFDGDGIPNADDPIPFVNETDHVITPVEPDAPTDTTQNDNLGDTEDNSQDVLPSQSEVTNTTSKDTEQTASINELTATTYQLGHTSNITNQLADQQSALPTNVGRDTLPIEGKNVLGATTLLQKKPQSPKSSKQVPTEDTRSWFTACMALLLVVSGAVIIWAVHKRSKK